MGARRVGGGVPAVADSRPKQSGGDNLHGLFRLLSRAQGRAGEQNAARSRVYYKDSDLFGRYVAFVFSDGKIYGHRPRPARFSRQVGDTRDSNSRNYYLPALRLRALKAHHVLLPASEQQDQKDTEIITTGSAGGFTLALKGTSLATPKGVTISLKLPIAFALYFLLFKWVDIFFY